METFPCQHFHVLLVFAWESFNHSWRGVKGTPADALLQLGLGWTFAL